MRKNVIKLLKILGAVIVSLVLIVVIGINTPFVQDKIVDLAVDAISKELQADVQIKGVNVNLLGQRVSVYGVRLRDEYKRELLLVDEIWGNFKLLPLLQGRVVMKEFKVNGIDVLLSKPDDGPANYQFLIDATKKKDGKKKKKKSGDSFFKLDLQHAMANKIHVRYNDKDYLLEQAVYSFWRDNRHVDIKGLHFKTDNHKPRKNTNKPHRGAFDAGHLDLTADLSFDILRADKDTIQAVITNCCAKDTTTGFDFKDVRADVLYSNKKVYLSDIVVYQTDTRFDIPEADIILPDKKKDRQLHYHADSVYVRTFLRDIAKPFAPALHRFSLPLNVKVCLDGYPNTISLRGIHVNTDDNKLQINATGILRNLKKAKDLKIHFEVHDMVARPGIKDKIINQFVVKKYMMYQIYALGVVKYHGSFDILWKKQQFRGLLNTEVGNVDFEFQLDGVTKYLTGNVSSDSLQLGQLFKMKNVHEIDAKASFQVDISKPRTREIRKLKGGKLPIGSIQADIRKFGYKSIHLKNIYADIKSDGALAEGDVTFKGNLTDLMLEFSFTDTEEMHKIKVKPHLKFRGIIGD